MSYRDDVDALYNRATTLQQEVDQMRDQLAERDRQLAEAKGGTFQRVDTSPGIRALRELPPAEELFSRLINSDTPPPPPPPARAYRQPEAPPVPIGWPSQFDRMAAIAEIYNELHLMSDERLELVQPLIKALAESRVANDVLAKLRELSAAARRA